MSAFFSSFFRYPIYTLPCVPIFMDTRGEWGSPPDFRAWSTEITRLCRCRQPSASSLFCTHTHTETNRVYLNTSKNARLFLPHISFFTFCFFLFQPPSFYAIFYYFTTYFSPFIYLFHDLISLPFPLNSAHILLCSLYLSPLHNIRPIPHTSLFSFGNVFM